MSRFRIRVSFRIPILFRLTDWVRFRFIVRVRVSVMVKARVRFKFVSDIGNYQSSGYDLGQGEGRTQSKLTKRNHTHNTNIIKKINTTSNVLFYSQMNFYGF